MLRCTKIYLILACVALQAAHGEEYTVNLQPKNNLISLPTIEAGDTNQSQISSNDQAASLLFRQNSLQEILAERIAKEEYPAIALQSYWSDHVCIDDSLSHTALHPLELLQAHGKCRKDEYEILFLKLCHFFQIPVRFVEKEGMHTLEFGSREGDWHAMDVITGKIYPTWDNVRLASCEELMDDPLLLLRVYARSDSSFKRDQSWLEGWMRLAHLPILRPQAPMNLLSDHAAQMSLRKIEGAVSFAEDKELPALSCTSFVDDANIPAFSLHGIGTEFEQMEWEIYREKNLSPSQKILINLEPCTETLFLSPLENTCFNPDHTYFFRFRVYTEDGRKSAWSAACSFTVRKPGAVVEVEITSNEQGGCELDWSRGAEESDLETEYFIFGSEALDFIPSVLAKTQVDMMLNGTVSEISQTNNLILVTSKTSASLPTTYPYYRILARRNGVFSTPSELIYSYESDQVQKRTVLQRVGYGDTILLQRIQLPTSYLEQDQGLPGLIPQEDPWRLPEVIEGWLVQGGQSGLSYEKSPMLSDKIWSICEEYMLPMNHPAKPKLDRLFSKRCIATPQTFRQAGFYNGTYRRLSRIVASSHPQLKDYFIKAYCDNELAIRFDWRHFIQRIEGTRIIRECIEKNGYEQIISVPHKYLYPLPLHTFPKPSSQVLPKSFVLVCDNAFPLPRSQNEKRYKRMTRREIDALYVVMQTTGLYDSVYPFNVPFGRDGKMHVIDTEYYYKWPVPFHKLTRFFSKDMQDFWRRTTRNGGRIPNGKTQPHCPRDDRRNPPPLPQELEPT